MKVWSVKRETIYVRGDSFTTIFLCLFGWKVNTIHRYERRHAYFCIRGANAGLMAASTKWEDEITAKYLFINRQQKQ